MTPHRDTPNEFPNDTPSATNAASRPELQPGGDPDPALGLFRQHAVMILAAHEQTRSTTRRGGVRCETRTSWLRLVRSAWNCRAHSPTGPGAAWLLRSTRCCGGRTLE